MNLHWDGGVSPSGSLKTAIWRAPLLVPLRFPLSANRASEEMGIDFANTIELGFYFSVFEAGAAECAPPMIRGEKTRIRSEILDQYRRR